MRITHTRSRYIYDLYYKREAISKELYDWLCKEECQSRVPLESSVACMGELTRVQFGRCGCEVGPVLRGEGAKEQERDR